MPIDPAIIVAIDDAPVVNAEDLNLAVTYEADIGEDVILTILQGGVEMDVTVTLSGLGQ